ncbi:hypothetical protein [Micromonospora eburnea]|uniref:hypothetical protein n=1 Tax=Micromonospora eburnea TaxID=227316 RepID=UPI00114D172B|nr:hypothetical protein [Micromonospora eburnea]
MESLRLRRTMIELTFRDSPLKILSFIACLFPVRQIGLGESAPKGGSGAGPAGHVAGRVPDEAAVTHQRRLSVPVGSACNAYDTSHVVVGVAPEAYVRATLVNLDRPELPVQRLQNGCDRLQVRHHGGVTATGDRDMPQAESINLERESIDLERWSICPE